MLDHGTSNIRLPGPGVASIKGNSMSIESLDQFLSGCLLVGSKRVFRHALFEEPEEVIFPGPKMDSSDGHE